METNLEQRTSEWPNMVSTNGKKAKGQRKRRVVNVEEGKGVLKKGRG